MSTLSCVTFVGGSITTFREGGRLGTDCWATDSAHLAVLSWFCFDPTLSISSATDWWAQVSDVFVLRLPLLSFFRFQGLAHAVKDVVRLLFAASLDVILALVAVVVTLVLVVAVVSVTLLSGDEVLFLHAPALTPTGALAIVALFLSLLLGFRAPFLRSVAFLMIASWRYWVVFCFHV